jgi:hypothetical protein
MNGKFFLAAIPEPHTVLGLRLKPFCAGHILLLHRTENALVSEDAEIDEAQLSFAVYICAHTYESGLASLDDASTVGQIDDWANQIGPFNLDEKLALFWNYVRSGSTVPTYSSAASGPPRSLSLPLLQIVKCTLLKAFGGMTESEFLNRPWGFSLWDFITLKGIEGAVDVFEDKSLTDAQAVADRMAERFNK